VKGLKQWKQFGAKKIALKLESEDQMMNIKQAAKEAGLLYTIIADAGRTQVAAGSKTVMAIFGNEKKLDLITGRLKLL